MGMDKGLRRVCSQCCAAAAARAVSAAAVEAWVAGKLLGALRDDVGSLHTSFIT